MTSTTEHPAFPASRSCPFAPPDLYTEAREDGRPRRVTIWRGDSPWLLTRHDHIQQMLLDPRFSGDVTLPGFPNSSPSQPDVEGGLFFRKEGDEHLPVRRILNPDFTAKRAQSWRPRIAELVDAAIDDMLEQPRPLDLIEHFALAVPTAVICEVLGVDQSETSVVHEAMNLVADIEAPYDDKIAAHGRVIDLLARYAEQKQDEPDDRLLSRLVNVHVPNGDITFDEAVRLGVLVIGAGHETTSNMLGLGALALIREPEQRAKLLADPDKLASTCTEEMLRYWTITQTEPRRVALEDAEIGGQLIKAGEGVVCSLGAANRDPEVFEDPENLDVARSERRHVAFGHGVHQCLGQNLARVEMQVAWPKLFARIPDLRLAVPESDLRFLDTHLTYGLHELPVTW